MLLERQCTVSLALLELSMLHTGPSTSVLPVLQEHAVPVLPTPRQAFAPTVVSYPALLPGFRQRALQNKDSLSGEDRAYELLSLTLSLEGASGHLRSFLISSNCGGIE